MKLMIASDIHGAAGYCRALLDAFDRERADRQKRKTKNHYV